jgi:hypothetical protein
MDVEAPLCAAHKNHWRARAWFTGLGFIALVVLFFVVSGLRGGQEKQPPDILCGGSAVLGLLWLIIAAILQATSVQPTVITKKTIKLKGVAPAFVEALQRQRSVGLAARAPVEFVIPVMADEGKDRSQAGKPRST